MDRQLCSLQQRKRAKTRGKGIFVFFLHLLYSLTPHESYFAEDFSWLHFYSSKKTMWQKKYEEIKEELAAALERRDNCTALLQKMEEQQLLWFIIQSKFLP